MHLSNDSRVVIIGGGPAGCFTALHLLRFAAEAGLKLNILILEPRDFNRPGPGGCNKCAGILSSRLGSSLEMLDLHLPPEVIQAALDSYVLHLGSEALNLNRPDARRRIISVYRGGGPRLGDAPYPHSFDAWLLEQTQRRGAEVQRTRARFVRRGKKPLVVTAYDSVEADLVVVASGVNSRAPLDADWGYHPPQTAIMAQDEVSFSGSLLGDGIHIFFDHPPGLVFGGIVPKGRYVNISLLGKGLSPDAVADFLEGQGLASLFPEGAAMLCGCTPRVAISPARGVSADRLVVVGDAAVTRLYKDGIGAAFITAEAAARTAIQRGVSHRDFLVGYHPICRRIMADNRYGRLLFRLWAFTRRSPWLLAIWRHALLAEVDLPSEERVYARMLWGMFTGDESYRQIFWLSMSRPALHSLWQGALTKWRER
jgi:flavin-dependent dehydrogenase